MTPDERLEAAKQAVRAKADLMRAQRVGYGPPCADCRHFIAHHQACGHIAYSEPSANPITGTLSIKWAQTKIDQARSDDGLCGPEAILFETRKKSRTQRFLRLFRP